MWYFTALFCVFLAPHGPVVAYKAAVVEYYAVSLSTPNATILKNLDEYVTFADQARSQAADIIVFPEYGLTTVGVDPQYYATEINDNNHVIKKLRTLASERQMYVVVNLLEKAVNGSRFEYYNTNLVLNRNGSTLKTYRKINLYKESGVTPGAPDQDVTFTTDFGTNFAIFTCADILFRNPARTALENSSVTDVIFPTAWVSHMPFYLSLSVQRGYAVENGVNLLAANYGKPKEGLGGSGIYLYNSKIAETYIGDTASSKLIVSDVAGIARRQSPTNCLAPAPRGLPGSDSRSNVTDFVTSKDFDASKYQFQSLDLTKNNTKTEVCDRKFCCTFEIILAGNQSAITETYKVMAFDGIVNYDSSNVRIRTCSLVACENGNTDSCGARINGTTIFSKITVKGNLPKDETSFYTPMAANSFLLPIRDTSYCDNSTSTNSTFVQLTTVKTQQNVLVFGIFGKTEVLTDPQNPDDPGNDGDDPNGSGSDVATIQGSFIALLIFALLTLNNL